MKQSWSLRIRHTPISIKNHNIGGKGSMEKYETVKMEVIIFETEDVIITSEDELPIGWAFSKA